MGCVHASRRFCRFSKHVVGEASGARGACPLRKLTRDALRLVCAAVVAAHLPEAEGVDEPAEACGPGHAEHGGEDGRAVPIDRLLMGCQLTSAD